MAYKGNRVIEEETLRDVISRSASRHEALKHLGLPTKGSYGYRLLGHFIDLYGIDVSHLVGRERVYLANSKAAIPLSEILEGKHPLYSGNLRERLIKEGIFERKCFGCDLTEWLGVPIPLALDHINGKPHDHRLTNLRLLCPNCHALTDTFCGRNTNVAIMKRARLSDRADQKQLLFDEQLKFAPLIMESGVDFSKLGWVSKIAPIIGRAPQKVRPWMLKYMPEWYAGCHVQVRSCRDEASLRCVRASAAERDERRIKKEQCRQAVRAAGIDFSIHGWRGDIARLTGCNRRHAKVWLERNVPDLFDIHFKK